jgi:hypothetical protein
MAENSDRTIICEGCGATAIIEDVPANRNPLPSGWVERIEASSPFIYDQTAYRCGECSAETESNDGER